MRSSTLFALLGAILLGLGVAVAAKAGGFLSRGEPKKEPPPQLVLAAAGNLFEGACLQAADVRLRPLRPDEVDAFKRGELLPPLTQAAVRRFAKVSIEADRAIRRDQLEDLNAPATLKERLAQGMEAVNMAIPKPHCAGGMINVGDWVNVQLTTAIGDGSGAATTSTALLARNIRVVAKRNSLWPVQTPLGPDCPVNFTLEMNPYRAALLSYVKDKGTLILSPLSDTDKRVLEARRNEQMTQPGVRQVAYGQPDSIEYKDEDARVADYLQGNYAVGEGDLMRIFRVKVEEPPAPAPPPSRVQQFVGIRRAGQLAFRDGAPVDAGADGEGGPSPAAHRHTTPQREVRGINGQANPNGGAARRAPSSQGALGGAVAKSPGINFLPPSAPKSGCATCKTPTMGVNGSKCGQK